MSNQDDLLLELSRLHDREDECHRLIHMIDDGVQELDMNAAMANVTTAALHALSDTIQKRIQQINQIIEFENGQTMTRFAHRRIT